MFPESQKHPLIYTLSLSLLVGGALHAPTALADGAVPVVIAQAPAGAGAPPAGGMPPGMPNLPPGGMMMPSAHAKAGLYIRNGSRDRDKEYAAGEVSMTVATGAKGATDTQADGVLLTSTDYQANGLVVNGGKYQFGGSKNYYTVYTNLANDYVGSSVTGGPNKLGDFNSVLLFTLNSQIPNTEPTGSSGADSSGNAVLNFDHVYMQVDGAQRYVTSTYDTAKTIVNDSYLVSTGNADHQTNDINGPFSNAALYISGVARNNFSVNASHTYYFNSTVITEGWAALSTDASQGDGLDLYAYNTKAKALNGGYGTYADFGCRVWLYGATLESAEVGAIIAKSGKITVLDGASADASITQYNKGASTKAGTMITAGRNAIMIHAPDMVGGGITQVDYGHFSAKNSTLVTSKQLVSKFDYGTLGEAAKQYVNYISGDIILVKSTSASIDLDNVNLESYNGVLVHTVLNSDGWSNYLAANDNEKTNADGSLIVKPISLEMTNMSATGAILHEDFQRNMEIKLRSTTLTGQIVQGTYNSWKTLWAGKDVTDANWLKDKTWAGSNTLKVSLDAKSTWTITAASTMSGLTIASGATVSALKGYQLTMAVNGVATAIAPGSYNGKIVIAPEVR
jgi:hypothetical protein